MFCFLRPGCLQGGHWLLCSLLLPRDPQPRALMYLIQMALYAFEVRTPTLALRLRLGEQAQAGTKQLREPRQPGNLLCLVSFRLFSQFPPA